MRHYDDDEYLRGDLVSPHDIRFTWFDWLCTLVFSAIVLYACLHKWMHWL